MLECLREANSFLRLPVIITMNHNSYYAICEDDLSQFAGKDPAFVAFGETMVRDTPADMLRAEETRQINISLSGSEHILSVGLARLGIPVRYITRVPDNPYGWMLRDSGRKHGIDTSHFVWAPKTEPIGRYIYEIGRTPRRSTAWYQRMYSAASRLGAGMVDWSLALKGARLFHVSGINFGLALHSGYPQNYNLQAFLEALDAKPESCKVGMDFNYRGTLWTAEECRQVLTPLLTNHIDWFITTIEDMAKIYAMNCGQYSADRINRGDIGPLNDRDLKSFAEQVQDRFKVGIVGITIRYPDSFETHRWESVGLDEQGAFFRSPAVRQICLWDRIGGGDTWNSGFYYGLLTETESGRGIEKGVLVGDAISRLKQTLMFDLPIITKEEVQALMKADITGGGKRESR
jgi:2-dehydro-3-deoxygluconokinase